MRERKKAYIIRHFIVEHVVMIVAKFVTRESKRDREAYILDT